MFRLLSWLLAALCLGGLAVVLLVPFAVLDEVPQIEASVRLKPPQIARARALLEEHNPRRLRDGDVRALKLSADELSLILDYVLAQLGGGAARVRLGPQTLEAALTARLPRNPIGRYLNAEIVLRESAARPRIERLRLGRITVPSLFVNRLLAAALRFAYARAGIDAPEAMFRGVEFTGESAVFHYQWHTVLADAVRQQFVATDDVERLREFQDALVAVTGNGSGPLPLPQLLAPLFERAAARASLGDPQADNRALLLVVISYLNGHRLTDLVPDAATWPRPSRRSVRLHGRVDLAKHFVGSAALAATGGQAVAQTMGVFKEIDDSRGGSGFSFVDLLADEAGMRFGRRATESRVVARALQPRAARALADADWMPTPEGLRENMSESEFNRRYGGVDGPGYRQVLADIDRRLDEIVLYR